MADKKYEHNEEITCTSMKGNLGVVVDKSAEDVTFQADFLTEIKELLSAKVELSKLIERGNLAEIEKNELQYELSSASKEAEELASKIKEVGNKSLKHKIMLLSMDSCQRSQDEHLLLLDEAIHHQHLQVLAELDEVNQQVSSLSLDIASAKRAKIKADEEIETFGAKVPSNSSCIDELKEIDGAKIEQVFADLNNTNVNTELGESEVVHLIESINKTKTKIGDCCKEVSCTKDLKGKLMVSTSDLNAMRSCLVKRVKNDEEPGTTLLLQSTKGELEEAKKQLSILQEEKFRLMNEIDVLRQEMNQITNEKANSCKISEESKSSLLSLNMKLHTAMSKLEYASNAEKRAQTIVSNLYAALEQLNNDICEAKQDIDLTVEEIKAINRQTQQFHLQTASMQERLETAMEELKAAKASEAFALENLRMVTETTMTERAIAALFSNNVTISKFEYLYLSRQGKAAQDVADLKVAAAKTWLKALKAEGKERYLRMQIAQKRTKWAVVPYEQKKRSMPIKVLSLKKQKNHLFISRTHDEEFMKSLNLKLAIAMPKRSLTVSGISGSGRANTRRSSISSRRPSISCPPSSPTLNDTPKKAVSNIVKFLRPPRRCTKQQYSCVGTSSALLY